MAEEESSVSKCRHTDQITARSYLLGRIDAEGTIAVILRSFTCTACIGVMKCASSLPSRSARALWQQWCL